jgi:rhodanese-related sulfurtransferase
VVPEKRRLWNEWNRRGAANPDSEIEQSKVERLLETSTTETQPLRLPLLRLGHQGDRNGAPSAQLTKGEIISLHDSRKLCCLTALELVAEQRNGAIVLDVRPAETFAALHIGGAIQIGLDGPFSSWAALLLKPKQAIVVVADSERSAEEANTRLQRVDLGQVTGYSLADESEWREQNLDLARIATARCSDIRETLQRDCSVQLVDVRSRAEWLKGHLPGAISVPLLDLESCAERIDPSKPSLVYCHEGFRATTAASILQRESSSDIRILIDGVEGWSAAGLPLEVPDAN